MLNPLYADKMFIAPYDTGSFQIKGTPFGTPDYFFHLIQPHLDIYKYKDLTPIFQRWYNWGPVMKNMVFFEVEVAANVWFPQAILYVIAYFTDLWGTSDGQSMQSHMRDNQRPLVWANGDDSGTVMCFFVEHRCFALHDFMFD